MKKQILAILVMASCGSAFALTQIHISPSGPDADGDGSASKPYASLLRARDAAARSGDSEIEIRVAPGEYMFGRGVWFAPESFKGKKVSIIGDSKGGAKPRFVGGVKVPAGKLREVSDKSVLSKIPSGAEGKLYSIDLKALGITDYGKMRQRGFGSPSSPTQMEAFLDGKALKLAQYPNDGKRIHIGEVLDPGYRRGIAAGQGAYKPKPDKNIRGATFRYDLPRTERWIGAPDAYISGYPSAGWAYDEIKIKKIDPQNKTITLESPHQYGVYSNNPPPPSKDDPASWVGGFDICMRGYKVINLLEELDSDGEYYIDRDAGVFYVMFKEKPADNVPLYFSVIEKPFIELAGINNFTVKGLDMSAARGLAIAANNCSDLKIEDCDIHGCGRAVSVTGKSASKRNKISGCKFYDMAYGVVRMEGGDRKTLERSDSSIEDCEFFDNARLIPCNNAAVSIAGVAITFKNNEIRNHPHVTMGHSGNELVIERNIFDRCGIEGSDMGVVYTGRNQTTQGNVIRHNFFTDTLPPDPRAIVCGVYVDDGSAGQLIEKNIFCRVGNMGSAPAFGAIYVHGGGDNIGRRNVFIDCQSGMSQQEWTDEKYGAALKRNADKYYKEVDVNSELYKKRYPKLEKQLTADYPRVNYVEDCRVWNSSVSMSGKIHLKRNKVLVPNEGVSKLDIAKIESWTLDDVRRCFGDDPVVKEALKGGIGIRKRN